MGRCSAAENGFRHTLNLSGHIVTAKYGAVRAILDIHIGISGYGRILAAAKYNTLVCIFRMTFHGHLSARYQTHQRASVDCRILLILLPFAAAIDFAIHSTCHRHLGDSRIQHLCGSVFLRCSHGRILTAAEHAAVNCAVYCDICRRHMGIDEVRFCKDPQESPGKTVGGFQFALSAAVDIAGIISINRNICNSRNLCQISAAIDYFYIRHTAAFRHIYR